MPWCGCGKGYRFARWRCRSAPPGRNPMIGMREDEGQNLVMIGSVSLEGWLDDSTCPRCGERRVYYLIYDAVFCAACNEWLEVRCDDPACAWCQSRPPRPLEPAVAQ